MYYEINISLEGYHFFATSDRSITSKHQLRSVLTVMLVKFPKKEGYKVSVQRKNETGEMMSIDEAMEVYP